MQTRSAGCAVRMPEVIKNMEQNEELGTTTWTYWLSLQGMWVIGGGLFFGRGGPGRVGVRMAFCLRFGHGYGEYCKL